ncbi:HlyD family secretion protein [Horticoccus luteus]|uniref:HlyD family secretion protein n=1 Tax=Horticoccus luteus TaxID=2862869 RepID=A0A8F9TW86_9BACT|nr:HlyD family secretion protein [Horticoccus luteus]QYM78903.1 HlyD family secretion protein [Horticoccus luteus]
MFLLVVVLVVGGALWWLHSRHYESTDDAALDATPQRVSAQVAGRVTRVLVADNQTVAVGAVLVELDSADAQTSQQQATAARAQAAAQLAEADARKASIVAQAAQARANLGVAETKADNAANDLQRLVGLRREEAGSVSGEQWDRAVAAEKTAAAQVEAAAKGLTAAQSQVQFADSQIAAARAGQASAEAQVRHADLLYSYGQIKAQIAGRVVNKSVAPGNFVTPGTALMAIVPRGVFVTANFKETQLTLMRPGQAVEITIDAYPDLKLTGRVDSVQAGTGQAFSALPAENASGNWVKVVQRVPVKITIDHLPDDDRYTFGPGMSVSVKVTVR